MLFPLQQFIETSTMFTVSVLMLAGLVGLIIPVYPGLVVIWIGSLIYGIVYGFTTPGIILFTIITLLMIGGEVIDNVIIAIWTRGSGVSWFSIILAMLASLIATFTLTPLVGIIAAPLVIYLFEWRRLQSWRTALQSLKGMMIGWGLGVVTHFGIGILMILLWVVWLWMNWQK
ncbi:MAG: DUF456 domain-containing protein [Chloroflexota bacterium]|jgi:uncharacterized protein YqgC (DUF456 family)